MSTLCVVDMQEEYVYGEPQERAVPNVLYEIRLAKRRKASIIVLKFKGWGDTINPVMHAIGKYPYHELIKRTDGGGYEIQTCAEDNGISLARVRLCGVNRGYCVYATAKELKHLYPGIKIFSAVNATWCSSPASGLQKLARVSRLLYHGDQIDKRKVKINRKKLFPYEYNVETRSWE